MISASEQHLNKVPKITLALWIIKIAARPSTLGHVNVRVGAGLGQHHLSGITPGLVDYD